MKKRFFSLLTMSAFLTLGLVAVNEHISTVDAASGDSFVKVTVAPSDWSGTYLIVSEASKVALKGSATTLDAGDGKNKIDVTISSGSIAWTEELEKNTFTISKNGSNYNVKSASGYYIGQSSNANGLKSSTSSGYANTITLKNGDVDMVSGGAYLRYNSSTASGNLRFRYYKSSSYTSQKAIQLYKQFP